MDRWNSRSWFNNNLNPSNSGTIQNQCRQIIEEIKTLISSEDVCHQLIQQFFSKFRNRDTYTVVAFEFFFIRKRKSCGNDQCYTTTPTMKSVFFRRIQILKVFYNSLSNRSIKFQMACHICQSIHTQPRKALQEDKKELAVIIQQ